MAKPVKQLNIDEIIQILRDESAKGRVSTHTVNNSVVAFLMDLPVGSTYKEYFNSKYFDTLKQLVLKTKYQGNIDNLIKLRNAKIWTLDPKEIDETVKKSKDPYWCVKYIKAFPELDRKEYRDIILKSKNPYACAEYLVNYVDDDLYKVVFKSGDRRSLKLIFQLAPMVTLNGKLIIGKKYIDTFFDEKIKRNKNSLFYPIFTEDRIKKLANDLAESKGKDKYPQISKNTISKRIVDMVNGMDCGDVSEDQKMELLLFLNNYIDNKIKQYELGDMIENNQLKLI